MSDNWEDWEIDELTVPNLAVKNEENLKLLEERKQVEDSDNALTKQLFSNEDEEDLAYEELKKIKNEEIKKEQKNAKSLKSTEKKSPSPKWLESKAEHERRQKEMSKKIKQEKIMKQKIRETFGEAEEEYDKYDEYEDKFY